MMYEKPKIEIISFLNKDIVTQSGELMLDGLWSDPGEQQFNWK